MTPDASFSSIPCSTEGMYSVGILPPLIELTKSKPSPGAGSMAVQEAARRAKPVLLEPVMAVEVVTPEEFLGDVIGDLSRRRGKVQGQEQRGNALAVQAFVPLGEMFGYATDLRSSTQGRATYTMQFERYEEVPNNIAEEIVEHRSGEPVGAAS